jgi:hypothetical protein
MTESSYRRHRFPTNAVAVSLDVHIFTHSKLPTGARAFEAFYKIDEVWPPPIANGG